MQKKVDLKGRANNVKQPGEVCTCFVLHNIWRKRGGGSIGEENLHHPSPLETLLQSNTMSL